MTNILIFGDLHITQNSLSECRTILNELLELCNKYSITHVIDLGDTYDVLKPNSLELDLFAEFIRDLHRPITIISANSHESIDTQNSIMNHYGILSDNVRIVKEYKDQNHLYCGHFVLTESNKKYGAKVSKESLKDYVYVFLGHQHSYQTMKPNICQLGSCRWVNFDEAKDKHKVVALISNYGEETEEVHFLGLKSPLPMVEIELNSNNHNELQEKDLKNPLKNDLQASIYRQNEELENDTLKPKSLLSEGENPSNLRQIDLLCQELDKLDKNTKVKIKIMDFQSFREFLPFVNKYNNKFEVFKYTTTFNVVSDLTPNSVKKEIINFKESFNNYLKNQKIDSKIVEILQKEIE